jgi:hypothetical protein
MEAHPTQPLCPIHRGCIAMNGIAGRPNLDHLEVGTIPSIFMRACTAKKITITNALSMGYAAIPCRTSALSKKAANSLQPKPSISSTLSNRNI